MTPHCDRDLEDYNVVFVWYSGSLLYITIFNLVTKGWTIQKLSSGQNLDTLKTPIHFRTQSDDPINCCGKPVQWTNEICDFWLYWSAPLVSGSDWSDRRTESESKWNFNRRRRDFKILPPPLLFVEMGIVIHCLLNGMTITNCKWTYIKSLKYHT